VIAHLLPQDIARTVLRRVERDPSFLVVECAFDNERPLAIVVVFRIARISQSSHIVKEGDLGPAVADAGLMTTLVVT